MDTQKFNEDEIKSIDDVQGLEADNGKQQQAKNNEIFQRL